LSPPRVPTLVVGAGIAGLCFAVALRQQGQDLTLIEQSREPRTEGAGIQLGPNAVRILKALGLGDALNEIGWEPKRLRVRDLHSGASLACLPLSDRQVAKYGQPTLTVHRADLQDALLARAVELGVQPQWGQNLESIQAGAWGMARLESGETIEAGLIVGADGLRGRSRLAVPKASRPNATGQIAIRGQLEVCPNPRSELGQEITVWCGSGQHVVGYPIRSGKLYGLVLIQDAAEWSLDQSWSTPWPAIRLSQLFGESNNLLRGFLESVDDWRAWPLWASEPLTGPDQLAFRHTALIGDAGHAMRPHLAQGAAMGIEDAWVLAHELRRLGSHESGIAGLENQPLAATHYANQRWQRIATVQQRAQRSGKIFQLRGPMALARNMALRAAGPQLMDQPWLYGHGLLGHATDVVL